jgi:hypothetical protein
MYPKLSSILPPPHEIYAPSRVEPKRFQISSSYKEHKEREIASEIKDTWDA